MENVDLTDTQSRTNVFRQGVLNNLHYWHGWLEEKMSDVAAVDQERSCIIRAISFALDLKEAAWPRVRQVIERFSPYMERRGHWSVWHQVLRRAIQVARHVGDTAGVVDLSVLLARLCFQQSRFEESTRYYRQTIHLARRIGDRFNEARACTNLGYYYVEKGHWHRAEVLCYHALQLFDQIDSDHGRAHTENHLGFLYSRQHHWAKAEQHLERACTIWEARGDKHGLMFGLINLGGLFIRKEQPKQALEYLKQAMHLAKLTGNETTIGTIYLNLGLANTIANNFSKAEAYAQQAETIFKRLSNFRELAQAWNVLGIVYTHQGKWSEAILHLENSLVVRHNLYDEIGEVEVLLDMIDYALAKDDRQQALAQLQEVEHLIGQDSKAGQYRHFQSRVAKYQVELKDSTGDT